MAYSYPLTMPTYPAPVSSSWKLTRGVSYSVSPFTGQQQVQENELALWQATITLPPMKREHASNWQAFFMKLHGRYGTFLMGDPDAKNPIGSVYGSGSTYAQTPAGQSVLYVVTTLNNGTNVFLPGDYIQIGVGASSLLFMVVDTAHTNGAGLCSVNVEPRAKRLINASEIATFIQPKGLFRMDTNDIGWNSDHVSRYGITFSCTEAA